MTINNDPNRPKYDPDRIIREWKGLPPLSDSEATARGIEVDRDGLVRCRVCGCTEREPCCPPCGWMPGEVDLCDACGLAVMALRNWLDGAHRPNKAALFREVEKRLADYCARCHGSGKVDRGNGSTKPCDCAAGLAERARRKARRPV